MRTHISDDTRHELAQLGPVSIEQCSCGTIHVHVGGASLRLHPDTFEAMCETMVRALVAVKVGRTTLFDATPHSA